MKDKRKIVTTMRQLAQREVTSMQGGVKTPLLFGTWLTQESVDPDLSQVQLEGEGVVARGVRKLSHVTGLIAGKQVLMVKAGSVPLTIIGIVVGDITKIQVP